MDAWLKKLFFVLVVRPVVLIALGLNVRHRMRLPPGGPAIVVANHNSHLDTLVLLSLFPLRLIAKVRPVAAADYFLHNRLLFWFADHVIGIVPIDRKPSGAAGDLLAGASAALDRGEILVLFPEGTRGEPEQLQEFKSGVAHLAARHPAVPVVPVFLHGLGKALPKGEALLVPFFCDVFVGETVPWTGDRRAFRAELDARLSGLAAEGHFPEWS